MIYVKSTLTNNYYALWDETTIENIVSGKFVGWIIVDEKEYRENIERLGL